MFQARHGRATSQELGTAQEQINMRGYQGTQPKRLGRGKAKISRKSMQWPSAMETCHGLWCNVDPPPLLSLHIMHMLIDPSSRSLFVPPHFQCKLRIIQILQSVLHKYYKTPERESPFFPSLPPSTIFFSFLSSQLLESLPSRDYIIGRAHLVQWFIEQEESPSLSKVDDGSKWWASMGAQVVDWAGRVWFKKI